MMKLYTEMYNKEIKEEFLANYPEATAYNYKYVFLKSFNDESAKNKDLYQFTASEIEDLIYDRGHITVQAVRNTYSIITSYINWAFKEGYKQSNISPMELISSNDLEKFVDKSKKRYLSINTIWDIENDLQNYQDSAIVELLFNGVSGYEFSEIINLMYGDVNWNSNELTLRDNKHGERKITVSDRCIAYIKRAYSETTYHTNNGKSNSDKIAEIPLVEGDHIIKNAAWGRNKNSQGADTHTIYRRVKMMKESFELPSLNPAVIKKSGQLALAKEIYEDKGEITNADLDFIAEKFGMRKTTFNNGEYYNRSSLKFIGEGLKEMYNIEI